METLTAESLTLQDLDPWLTPMQAAVWIGLRNPLLVRRASLEERESKEAATFIPNDIGCTDPSRAGMSLHSLDHFLGLVSKRPVNSADLALRCLMGALRRGEVNASAEPYRAETGTRSGRVMMSPMEWAGITLADAPGDDRKLVTYSGPEISQFLTGQILDTRWQGVRINTLELLARFPVTLPRNHPSPPDQEPTGYLFIDKVVTMVMAKLHMPEGPALKWLCEKLQTADIQSYTRHGPRLVKVSPGAWADADIDLMEFREPSNTGLRLYSRVFHLHHVVLSEPDFEFCLMPKVQASAEPWHAGKTQASVPAALTVWMRQHMLDGLSKHSLLPKRNPSVQQCMEVFGCSWRIGLAAYKALPDELRRSARETDRALKRQ